MKTDATILSSTVSASNRNEALTKLLVQADNTHTQPTDQKERIKVAFAEGYLAANNTDEHKSSRTVAKLFKVRTLSEN